MRKKEKRLLGTILALVVAVAALGATSQPAAAVVGSCLNVSPFCNATCSCAPLNCDAQCDDSCGQEYVWCYDPI